MGPYYYANVARDKVPPELLRVAEQASLEARLHQGMTEPIKIQWYRDAQERDPKPWTDQENRLKWPKHLQTYTRALGLTFDRIDRIFVHVNQSRESVIETCAHETYHLCKQRERRSQLNRPRTMEEWHAEEQEADKFGKRLAQRFTGTPNTPTTSAPSTRDTLLAELTTNMRQLSRLLGIKGELSA